MPRLRHSPALACAFLLLIAPFAHQFAEAQNTQANSPAKHPFSIEDLVRLQRVSEPVLSPDGKTAAFTVRETDMAANRGRTDLWSLDLATKGAQPRRLTSHPENDGSPQWSADGKSLYFLSSRSGASQVWRLHSTGGEAEQVTNLPVDVGTFKLAPNAMKLAITADVFADCADFACTADRLSANSKAKSSGAVFDRIFIRHWDLYGDRKSVV